MKKAITIIKELKAMIYEAKNPLMDDSHKFDLNKADKKLTELYEVIK